MFMSQMSLLGETIHVNTFKAQNASNTLWQSKQRVSVQRDKWEHSASELRRKQYIIFYVFFDRAS